LCGEKGKETEGEKRSDIQEIVAHMKEIEK